MDKMRDVDIKISLIVDNEVDLLGLKDTIAMYLEYFGDVYVTEVCVKNWG